MGWFVGIANPEGESDDHKGEELTKKELEQQCNNIVGLPMFDDHDYKKLIGRIAGSWLQDGKLWILGKVNEATKCGKEVYDKIKSGEYRGLSLGSFGMRCEKTKAISDRLIAEASPCPGKEGKRPGTSILLTLNSGTDSEQQVTMNMQPISGITPLGFGQDVPFDAPDNMIQDIFRKAQQFIIEQTASSGLLRQSHKDIKTTSEDESGGDSDTSSNTCENCKRSMTQRKINTDDSGKCDMKEKEPLKSSILSDDLNNVKKIEGVSSTSSTKETINTKTSVESAKNNLGKSNISTQKTPEMEKSVHFEESQTPPSANTNNMEGSSSGTSSAPDKSHSSAEDDVYKNDQLDLSGAIDAPLGPGNPIGGSAPPLRHTMMPKAPNPRYTNNNNNNNTSGASKLDESMYYESPSQLPVPATSEGAKRKAYDQPRNERGQWTKKPRGDQESQEARRSEDTYRSDGGSSIGEDIDGLLNKIAANQSGEANNVTLSRSELAELFSKIKSGEQAQKEREEAQKELLRVSKEKEELQRQREAEMKKFEKESKHSKVSALLSNARKYIETAKELSKKDPEGEDFWRGEIDQYSKLIEDEDALYQKQPSELDHMNRQTLVLTRASNTKNREIAEVQGMSSAQMKKFESLLSNSSGKSFDSFSGRLRGPSEVSGVGNTSQRGPMSKFESILNNDDGNSSTGSSMSTTNPAVGSTTSRTTTHTSFTEYGHEQRGSIPTFFGADSAPDFIRPFKVQQICRPDDPNKDIFASIERDLGRGGYLAYTNFDTPGLVGREWYDKPYRVPGVEGIGRSMALPPPKWKAAQQAFRF